MKEWIKIIRDFFIILVINLVLYQFFIKLINKLKEPTKECITLGKNFPHSDKEILLSERALRTPLYNIPPKYKQYFKAGVHLYCSGQTEFCFSSDTLDVDLTIQAIKSGWKAAEFHANN